MWLALTFYWEVVLGTIVWAAAGALVLWLLLIIPYQRTRIVRAVRSTAIEDLVFLYFGCLLGAAVGVVTGVSRQPAITAVVPSVLTLIGALIGYLYSTTTFGTESKRFTVLVGAIAVVLFFSWGTLAGGVLRYPADEDARVMELNRLRYATDLENTRLRFEMELKRAAMKHQAELDLWLAREKQKLGIK